VAARERGLSAWDGANSTTDGTAELLPLSAYLTDPSALGLAPAVISDIESKLLIEYLGMRS
jgi:hypothetical protein